MTDNERILKLSLDRLTKAFNTFISTCIDNDGNPKQPSKSDIMKARAYLPNTQSMSLTKKTSQISIECEHKRASTTALGVMTNTGWTCQDCGKLLSDKSAIDKL